MVTIDEIKSIAEKIGRAASAEKVLLFGSYAKGCPKADSDVDYLIIAQSDLSPVKRMARVYASLNPYPFSMDIVVYTPQEIRDALKLKFSFISSVMKEAVPVYVRSA